MNLVTNNPADTTPAIGTPAYRAAESGLGYVYAVGEDDLGGFAITGAGLVGTNYRVSIVWENLTTSERIADGIAAPWLNHAAAKNAPAVSLEALKGMVADADEKHARHLASVAADRDAAANAADAFRAKVAPLIPANAKACIVAELIQDQSDSMSDYHGGRVVKTILLGFSTHNRDLFTEMRKAALNHEETADLATAPESANNRQKYSMGGGYFLKMGNRYSDGWKISKQRFYEGDPVRSVPVGEIAITPPRKAARPAPAVATAPVGETPAATMSEHTHTKKGFQMWIVTLASRVDRATYDSLLAMAKGLGGWYSRAWGQTPGGYAFKDQDAAKQFFASLQGPAINADSFLESAGMTREQFDAGTPAGIHEAKLVASVALADKLDGFADSLQSKIEDKRRDRPTNTPKRRRECASARQDANDLERSQQGLRALATMHRAGTASLPLSEVTTKKAALELGQERFDYSQAGYYDAGRPTGEPKDTSALGRAFWALAKPKTPQEQRAEDLAAAKLKIDNGGRIAGFFPTPAKITTGMVDCADIRPGQKVLEPNGGTGAIADSILRRHPDCDLTMFEINGTLCEFLRLSGHDVTQGDFLEEAPALAGTFDAAIMNPPFENGQDMQHVKAAYECLKPGGFLIAIMSPSYRHNSAKKFSDFRAWLAGRDSVAEDLPVGTFKESGTMVATVLLKIWKA